MSNDVETADESIVLDLVHRSNAKAVDTAPPVVIPYGASIAEPDGGGHQLTRRQQVEMERDARIKKEQDQQTFRPNLKLTKKSTIKVSADDSGVARTPVYDRLFAAAAKKNADASLDRAKSAKRKTKNEKPERNSAASSQNNTSAVTNESENDQVKNNDTSTSKPNSNIDNDRLYRAFGAGRSKPQVEPPKEIFAPQISKFASKKAGDTKRSSLPSGLRLYAQATAVKSKYDDLAEKLLRDEMQQCTFAPTIITPKKKEESGVTSSATVTDRLLNYEIFRLKKLEEARKNKELKEKEENSFKPSLVTKHDSSNESSPSLLERMEAYEKSRLKKLEDLAKEKEKRDESTFKPTLATSHHHSKGVAEGEVHIVKEVCSTALCFTFSFRFC